MNEQPHSNGSAPAIAEHGARPESIERAVASVAESAKPNWGALGVMVTALLAFGGLVANGLYQADRDARDERHAIEADVKRLMIDVATLMERSRENEARLDRIDP